MKIYNVNPRSHPRPVQLTVQLLSEFFYLTCGYTGAIYAEITDEESKEPTYASVGVATAKYTCMITTNSSCDTVLLHNMNPNACYGKAT